MISISAKTFYPSANIVLFNYQSNRQTRQRRITRTATLDGGVSVIDGGCADGDRDITLSAMVTKAQADILETIQRNNSRVTICQEDGAYDGALQKVGWTGNKIDLTLMIISRVSA
jgi:hypothetical protein